MRAPHCRFWGGIAARLNEALKLTGRAPHRRTQLMNWLGAQGTLTQPHLNIDGKLEGSAEEWEFRLGSIAGSSTEEQEQMATEAAQMATAAHQLQSQMARKGWTDWIKRALARGAGAAHRWTSSASRAQAVPQVLDGNIVTQPTHILEARCRHWEKSGTATPSEGGASRSTWRSYKGQPRRLHTSPK